MADPTEKEEPWLKSYWRPAMAWQYLVICVFDFMLAPIAAAWYAWFAKIPYQAWKPLTLQDSGLYHIAMGAIIGVTAWTRGNENIAKINSESNSNNNSQ